MHKKLIKYIESYEEIQKEKSYFLVPNGGMIVLINQKNRCEVIIDDNSYIVESYQSVLINAYTSNVEIKSDEIIGLVAIRFKGAGASFFYEEYMDELMYNPNEIILLEKEPLEEKIDTYLLNRLKVGTIPFNIMKIIELLDEQKNNYNIDELLAIANVPRRTVDKIFRLRVGMTFKTYASIKEQKH